VKGAKPNQLAMTERKGFGRGATTARVNAFPDHLARTLFVEISPLISTDINEISLPIEPTKTVEWTLCGCHGALIREFDDRTSHRSSIFRRLALDALGNIKGQQSELVMITRR
jgi:hypothetical protein